jgi:hypothetical protein
MGENNKKDLIEAVMKQKLLENGDNKAREYVEMADVVLRK